MTKDKIQALVNKVQEEIQDSSGRVSVMIEGNGIYFEHNSVNVYSAASLIKIPLFIEVFLQIEAGNISADEKVTVTSNSKVGGAGVLQALRNSIEMTIMDLLTLMIIVSDNTATNLLLDRLNQEWRTLLRSLIKLEHTRLNRKMMDFEAIKIGKDNFTSASDIIKCLKFINEDKGLRKETKQQMLTILNQQQFKEKLPSKMDKDHIWIGNKTGELPGVEHDCAIIKYKGNTVYACVLIDQVPTESCGKQTIGNIGKAISDYLIE